MTADQWQAQLRSRIYGGFAQSNWAAPLANALGIEYAQLDAAMRAAALLWSIDPVTDDPASSLYGVGRGVQLDRIGALVGAARSGLQDGPYRAYLRAKIRANKSNGSPKDVIAVFVAMFAGAGTPLYRPGWIAAFSLRLVGVIMPPLEVPIALLLLSEAALAGVYAVLEWTSSPPDHVFTFNALGANQGWGDLGNVNAGGAMGGAAIWQ